MDQHEIFNSINEETQVFIVRLWCEQREITGRKPLLRGTVNHVLSGNRKSVNDVNSIVAFLLPYVENMGVDIGISEDD